MINYPFFCYWSEDGCFWLRIWGYGLNFIDRTKHEPLFSERIGIKKPLRIGKWAIKTLKP